MKLKTTFAHSLALKDALATAAHAEGRKVSCLIRRILEKHLDVNADLEATTSPKTPELPLP